MKKQIIKQSEARILIYLSVVDNTKKHVTGIANKLEMDYSYCMRVLQAMVAKGWLKKHSFKRFMFYDLTPKSPLELAKNEYYASDDLQKKLQLDKLAEDYEAENIREKVQEYEVVPDDDE